MIFVVGILYIWYNSEMQYKLLEKYFDRKNESYSNGLHWSLSIDRNYIKLKTNWIKEKDYHIRDCDYNKDIQILERWTSMEEKGKILEEER